MTIDDWGRVAFFVLLLAGFTVFALPQGRAALRRALGQAAAWALIFTAVALGVGLFQDIRSQMPVQSQVGGVIEVPRGPDGHYHLTLGLNGTPVRFVVDTGASDMVLSRADAARAGVDLDEVVYTGLAQTANGTVRVAGVRLKEVRLGDLVDRNVRASVTDGEMEGSLLGMSYLERFARISIERGRLVLER